MISISQVVQQIVEESPFIEEAISQGILNLSQYAEIIKKRVEEKTFKKVTKGSIITALSRIEKDVTKKFTIDFQINDLSLKFPLSEIVFASANLNTDLISQVYKHFSGFQNHFLNIISGNTEINVFINSKYEKEFLSVFEDYKPVNKISNLAGISLKFSDEYFQTKGLTYQVLKTLVWEGVDLVEIISTYTEITLIIKKEDANKVFDTFSKLLLND